MNKKKEILTLEGVLVASDWDRDDSVIGISLYTDDEEEYQIENMYEIDEWLTALEKRIEVTGEVTEDKYGGKTIRVLDYDIPEYEEGWL